MKPEQHKTAKHPAKTGTGGYDEELIEVVKRDLMPKDSTDADLKRFLLTCKEYGFSPMRRQLYAMAAGGRIVMEATIDGLLSLAAASPDFAGVEETVYEYDKDGHVGKATVKVCRFSPKGERYVAATTSALWKEYGEPAIAKLSDRGRDFSPWVKMPTVMLEKVALARCLRRAFPRELGGLYSRDEMEGARD